MPIKASKFKKKSKAHKNASQGMGFIKDKKKLNKILRRK